jgi:hypothetical protein
MRNNCWKQAETEVSALEHLMLDAAKVQKEAELLRDNAAKECTRLRDQISEIKGGIASARYVP